MGSRGKHLITSRYHESNKCFVVVVFLLPLMTGLFVTYAHVSHTLYHCTGLHDCLFVTTNPMTSETAVDSVDSA